MRELPPWAQRVATAAVVAVLVAWSFWQRWHVLDASPFPRGIDGYYYPVQIRSLIEHGTLQYAASPLTFWWLVPFALVTDPIVGAKLGAALGGALIAVPAYVLGARLGRGRGPGIVAAAIAACSTSSQYLTVEFVKQGLGFTVALFALWLVLRATDLRSRRRLAAAGGGLVAAFLAHKAGAAIVVAIGVPAFVAQARHTGALRGRRLLYVTGAATVAAVVLVICGLAMPERFVSSHDLHLAGSLVTSDARWTAPALVLPPPRPDLPPTELAFHHDALIGGLVAIAAALVLLFSAHPRWLPAPLRSLIAPSTATVQPSHADRVAAWAAVVLGIAIALPWLVVTDPAGLGFRLRVSAFVPLALCAATVARGVLGWLGDLDRDLLCLVVAIAVAAQELPPEGQVTAHPQLVEAARALDGKIPADATVLASERHIAYMVAWYAHARIAFHPDDVAHDQRVRVLMPLSTATGSRALRDALHAARLSPQVDPPLSVHPGNIDGMVLVTERTWDWMLAHMSEPAASQYAAWPTI